MNPEPGRHPTGRIPFAEMVGFEVLECTGGRSAIALLIEEKHLRSQGILHGGVIATLVDAATGYAAYSVAPAGHHVLTVQLNINFVRPAVAGQRLIATGEVLHRGTKTIVADCRIHSPSPQPSPPRGRGQGEGGGDENLIASGSGTFMMLAEIARPE